MPDVIHRYKIYSQSELEAIRPRLLTAVQAWSSGWVNQPCTGLSLENRYPTTQPDTQDLEWEGFWVRVSRPIDNFLFALMGSRELPVSLFSNGVYAVVQGAFQDLSRELESAVCPADGQSTGTIPRPEQRGSGWISLRAEFENFHLDIGIFALDFPLKNSISPRAWDDRLSDVIGPEMFPFGVYARNIELTGYDLLCLKPGDILQTEHPIHTPLLLKNQEGLSVSPVYIGKHDDRICVSACPSKQGI